MPTPEELLDAEEGTDEAIPSDEDVKDLPQQPEEPADPAEGGPDGDGS